MPRNTEKAVTQRTLSRPPAARSMVGMPLATPYFRSCRFTRAGTVTAGERAPRIHLSSNTAGWKVRITLVHFNYSDLLAKIEDVISSVKIIEKVVTFLVNNTFLPEGNYVCIHTPHIEACVLDITHYHRLSQVLHIICNFLYFTMPKY